MAHAIPRNQAAAASQAPRRPTHVLFGIAAGFVFMYAVGALAVILVNDSRLTGDRTDVFSYIIGMPLLLGIAGGVFGAIISVLSYAEEEDVPVRETADHQIVVDDRASAKTTQ